jgi:23S rRNA (adenine2030-N6)-methyltransferase
MNYRHAFHAGNFADVLKHIVLSLCLDRMTRKPKPLRVIDTHAGVGRYRLGSGEAERTGEWRGGIGRLMASGSDPLPPTIAAILAPYLDSVRAFNPSGDLAIYPGSPLISLALMRPGDRMAACELHPEDAAALRRELRHDGRAKVLEMDGWQALRATLPPNERRGLILIDPPFEEAGELDRLVKAVGDGTKRFATGTYLLWLPIKDVRQSASFANAIGRMEGVQAIWIELRTQRIETAERLAGSALVVINPPFGLEQNLQTILPWLSERLATGEGAAWRLDTVA